MPQAERPADGLSILSLAAGIASLVLVLFSVMPLLGWCTMPLSALSAAVALISGIASVIRTSLNKTLEGRAQAITGLVLSLVWFAGAALLLTFAARH